MFWTSILNQNGTWHLNNDKLYYPDLRNPSAEFADNILRGNQTYVKKQTKTHQSDILVHHLVSKWRLTSKHQQKFKSSQTPPVPSLVGIFQEVAKPMENKQTNQMDKPFPKLYSRFLLPLLASYETFQSNLTTTASKIKKYIKQFYREKTLLHFKGLLEKEGAQ